MIDSQHFHRVFIDYRAMFIDFSCFFVGCSSPWTGFRAVWNSWDSKIEVDMGEQFEECLELKWTPGWPNLIAIG